MNRLQIDLNADMGESPERLADGSDAELMRYITSASVACGGHAGNESTMEQTLELARENHVAVGAHPSYPDRAGFGRTALDISLGQLQASVSEQLNELLAVAKTMKMRLVHVKPHGALYHACNQNGEIARAVARAVISIDPALIVIGQAGLPCLSIYPDMGLRVAAEAFADRAYEADGTLRNRSLPGALLESPDAAAQQAVAIALRKRVSTASGADVEINANTLCIHSDTPGAAKIARAVREQLHLAGVGVCSLSVPS